MVYTTPRDNAALVQSQDDMLEWLAAHNSIRYVFERKPGVRDSSGTLRVLDLPDLPGILKPLFDERGCWKGVRA